MVKSRLFAGHERHTDGLISLYAGLEVTHNKPGFFIVSRKKKRLNQKQFKRLDDAIRYKSIEDAFVVLTSDDFKYFWRRLAVQLNRCYPEQSAIELFIEAWVSVV